MTDEGIAGRIRKILVEEFELSEADLTLEADLFGDLGLDSLDSVDLVVAMEKEFAFKINRAVDENTIREMRTIEEMCAFVKEKIGAGARQT